jgi:adenosylhomocysteine nucleosidase
MIAAVAITDPCLVFALRRESMFFRRSHAYQQAAPGAPCRAQFRGLSSQTILMLETGLGARAMEAALAWCLNSPRCGQATYRPRRVLLAGFSGALRPGQRVGDVILASEVIDESGHCWPVTWEPDLPASDAMSRGRVLTVSHLVGDPEEKQRLGQQYQALAVDMETVVLARRCSGHGVPFACIRVISDDLSMPLSPRLLQLMQGGRVSPVRLAWYLFRQPSLSHELWKLAVQTRYAARRLAIFCDRLLGNERMGA